MELKLEGLLIKNLPLTEEKSLQKLFEDSRDYIQLSAGRDPKPNDAEDLFQALPPGKTLKDKFVLGIYDADSLIGIIDLIKDYPEEGIRKVVK